MQICQFATHVPLSALLLAAAACTSSVSSEGEGTGDGGFTDERGRTWILVGDAEISDSQVADSLGGPAAPVAVDLDELIVEMSREEAADMLRPRLEIGGKEYTVSEEDALEFADHVREVVEAGGVDEPAGFPEGVDPVAPVDQEGDVKGRKIINGRGVWIKVNSWADNWPFNMVATMDEGYGRCTAFKAANHHTAVTAGHCVEQGGYWAARQRIRFGAGSANRSSGGSGDSKNYLPPGCYGRALPTCYGGVAACDYAVLYLRGKGAHCELADYDTGYFGYKPVERGAIFVRTRMASYPADPPWGGYPSLYFQSRGDGWASGDQLRYRLDMLPGSSGAPVFDFDENVRAVNVAYCTDDCQYNIGQKMTTTMWEFIKAYGGS
jgi:hypothetical protein